VEGIYFFYALFYALPWVAGAPNSLLITPLTLLIIGQEQLPTVGFFGYFA
jgi:hypothetical protein